MSEIGNVSQDQLKPRWFAVFDDFSLKEYIEPNPKVNCLNWVKLQPTGKSHTTQSWNNTHYLNDYFIYDKDLSISEINKRDWKIIAFKDPATKNSFEAFLSNLADPFGEVRVLKGGYNESGIKDALLKLKECSEFASWLEYEMSRKIKELELKLEVTEKINSDLYEQKYAFEEKIENVLKVLEGLDNEKVSAKLKNLKNELTEILSS